ncbi:MAG: FlgD immunoglobulin-like domain containing protein [bacterium]
MLARVSAINESPGSGLARAFSVAPSPSAGRSTVSFELPHPVPVSLSVIDAAGRTVRRLANGTLASGPHRFALDPAGLPAGVYQCVLAIPGRLETRPLVLTR